MTTIELVHKLKEKTTTARYMAKTPEYAYFVDGVLEEIEYFAQVLIDNKEQIK